MFAKRRSHAAVRQAVRPVLVSCQAMIEGLENRTMLSATLSAHGVLTVSGTPHSDTISVGVDPTDSTELDVTVNGATKQVFAANVHAIKINGAGGADAVAVDSSLTTPVSIAGGGGNDSLTAGSGNDTLNGGAGNDSLTGGTGTDSLVGGTGNDTIQCSEGADSVNGGTGHDAVDFSSNSGVTFTSTPAAVQNGLTTLAQGATVSSVQPFLDNGQTYYGAEVNISGQDTRIVVNSSGTPVGNAPPVHGRGGGDASSGDSSGPSEDYGIFGSVVSVDTTADTITISAANPWGPTKQTTFTLTSTTTITADSATATLAQLTAGTLVCIQTSSTATTTATSITAIDKRVFGTVASVDATAKTISVTGFGGTTTTYTVDPSATVTVSGVAGTLSAVTTGTPVELALGALTGNAITINAGSHESDGGSGGHSGNEDVGGKFVSADTTANTITLQNGVGIQTTYTLTSSTTVSLDGATSTISALVAGDRVELSLASDGKTVNSIDASDQTSTGGGGGGGGGGDGPHQPAGIFGSVVSVDTTANTITIQAADSSTPTTYTLATGATVSLDGQSSTLSALVAGDNAFLQLTSGATTVASINASDKAKPNIGAQGKVVSVDTTANTITVQGEGGTSKTYTLGTSATVTLNGTASTLSALIAGDEAHLQLASDGTVTAIDASYKSEAGGKVVSVDTTANTITLSGEGGSSTTYTLGTGATVTLNGASSTLSAIVAGDFAQLQLASDGTATSVTAGTPSTSTGPENNDANGKVLGTTAITITLQGENGASTTYTLGTGATVTLNGTASTLSAIIVGDFAHLVLASDGTASSVSAFFQSEAGGKVVSTTATTISLQSDGGTPKVYTLGTGATVTLDGTASTLSAIVAGDSAHLQLAADGTVTSIGASDQTSQPGGGGNPGGQGGQGGRGGGDGGGH